MVNTMYAKQFKVDVTVPEGLTAGDSFTITVEAPELPKRERSILNGITLDDMTEDQLKKEIINAKSVLYKARKREADPDTIAANQARVDAAEAMRAKKFGVPASNAPVVGHVVCEGPVDTDAAAEM
jgi:hypothetical protein